MAVLIGGCSTMSLLVSTTRGGPGVIGGLVGAVVAFCFLVLGYRGFQRLRSRAKGGDVLWLVTQEEILVRRADVVHRVRLDKLGDIRRSRSLLRTWSRFHTVPRFMTTGIGLVQAIWVRRREVDDVELLLKLKKAMGREPQ